MRAELAASRQVRALSGCLACCFEHSPRGAAQSGAAALASLERDLAAALASASAADAAAPAPPRRAAARAPEEPWELSSNAPPSPSPAPPAVEAAEARAKWRHVARWAQTDSALAAAAGQAPEATPHR